MKRNRAPHGKPEHTERIGVRVPRSLAIKFRRKGGSAWLRQLMEKA